MSQDKRNPGVITTNMSLDEAQTLVRALYPIIRTTNNAKAVLQGKGWISPNGEVTLKLLAKVLFVTAMNSSKMESSMTNAILAIGFLITEQTGSLTKTNIVNRVTKHLLDTLIPITTNFEAKLEEHLKAVANSTTQHLELSTKLQQAQVKLDETAEKAMTNMKSHSDLIDKLQEIQEKLEEASQKAATNVKTYSQAAATP